MPRGGVTQTRTFNYSLTTGRLTSATNPETGTVTYTYNTNGTVATKTDARGVVSQYTYDGFQRVTQAGGVSYYYDSNPFDAAFSTNSWGRMTAMQYSGGGLSFIEMYDYSRSGLLARKRLRTMQGGAAVDKTASFAYGTGGRYLGVASYPSPHSPAYTYTEDSMGRPYKLTRDRLNPDESPMELVRSVTYGVAGEMTQMKVYDTQRNTVRTVNQTYNNLFQLTRITAADWETRVDMEYRYTAGANNGRIAQMKDSVRGEEVSYTYDSLNRLIAAVTTGPEYGLSYSYDGFGNRTEQTLTKGSGYSKSLSYSGQTNRITTPGYSCDAAGNMVTMPGLTMYYDEQNRIVQTQMPTATKYYGYNGRNERVWTKDPTPEGGNDSWNVQFYGPDGQGESRRRISSA